MWVLGEEVCGVVGLLYPEFGSEGIKNRNESGDFSGAVSHGRARARAIVRPELGDDRSLTRKWA